MDLARSILLAVEKLPASADWVQFEESDFPGYTLEQVYYHVKLLAQAGYIEAEDASTFGGTRWFPSSLTWAGHEFLDAVRNDTVWSKTKALAVEKGGTIPFELVKELAIHAARAWIGQGG